MTAHATVLGPRFQEALVYAVEVHRHQVREGHKVPFLGHVLGTARNAITYGADEDEAIAALLHDAAEDRGGLERLADIRERFGDRVADIVAACSDTFVRHARHRVGSRARRSANGRWRGVQTAVSIETLPLPRGEAELGSERARESDSASARAPAWTRYAYMRTPRCATGGHRVRWTTAAGIALLGLLLIAPPAMAFHGSAYTSRGTAVVGNTVYLAEVSWNGYFSNSFHVKIVDAAGLGTIEDRTFYGAESFPGGFPCLGCEALLYHGWSLDPAVSFDISGWVVNHLYLGIATMFYTGHYQQYSLTLVVDQYQGT
jgi:hypothetical protein